MYGTFKQNSVALFSYVWGTCFDRLAVSDGLASNSAGTQRVCSGLNIFISESFDRLLEGLASYTSGTE
jgi:hypothetical protein